MTNMNFIPKESQGSDFVTHKRSHRRKRENDLSIKREIRARRKARCSEKS